MIEGELPPRARKLVVEWAEKYQAELQTIWKTQEFKKTASSGVTQKMQIPKILNVAASDHKLLTIIFTNGEKKTYDVSRLWDNKMFTPLKNPSFFKNVKIEKGG